jgi:isopropylmalate/homocitrate/citramalate synthase
MKLGSQMPDKKDFESSEESRRKTVNMLLSLSRQKYDPDAWRRLKEILYPPRRLDVDVAIDDSTLREGLQMAGLTTPAAEDLAEIGRLLYEVGVERIEVMTYTPTDKEAIRIMMDNGLQDVLAGWSRAVKEDIDSILALGLKQVGISHPVSYYHFAKWPEAHTYSLTAKVVETVEYAVDHGLRVFVHGEDSTRADWDFERKFVNAVAEAGAEVYRICDTIGVGCSLPDHPLPNGIPEKVRALKRETGIRSLEIHAHDDLGNAVENTMAAARAASGLYDKFYVSTTFLGIGERSGNAETEKIMLNMYIHHGVEKWNLPLLRETANFISTALNYHLPTNKAIVGDSAFAHESGIHLQGIKIAPAIYEIFPPELVGQTRKIIIGRRTGKHGIVLKLRELINQDVDEEDPRLKKLVELVRGSLLQVERKYYLTEEEFKKLAAEAGFKI